MYGTLYKCILEHVPVYALVDMDFTLFQWANGCCNLYHIFILMHFLEHLLWMKITFIVDLSNANPDKVYNVLSARFDQRFMRFPSVHCKSFLIIKEYSQSLLTWLWNASQYLSFLLHWSLLSEFNNPLAAYDTFCLSSNMKKWK